MGRVLKGSVSRILIDIKPEFARVCTSYYQVFQPSTASCCNLYLWKNQGYDENSTSCGRDFLKSNITLNTFIKNETSCRLKSDFFIDCSI